MSSVTKTLLPGIVAGAAVRDANGKRINTYYAKASDLSSLQSTVTTLDGAVVKKAAVIDNLTSTGTTDLPLSANQGYVLKGMIDAINALLASNDTDLDTIQEIVTYIKANKTSIESITSGKVNVSDIIDNVTSAISNKPLSANQGKVLKGLIDGLDSALTTLSGTVSDLPTDSDVASAVGTEETRAKGVENGLAGRITTLEGKVSTLEGYCASASSVTVTDWEE